MGTNYIFWLGISVITLLTCVIVLCDLMRRDVKKGRIKKRQDKDRLEKAITHARDGDLLVIEYPHTITIEQIDSLKKAIETFNQNNKVTIKALILEEGTSLKEVLKPEDIEKIMGEIS